MEQRGDLQKMMGYQCVKLNTHAYIRVWASRGSVVLMDVRLIFNDENAQDTEDRVLFSV